MLAAIRLKGEIKVRGDIKDTLQILGLRKKLSMVVLKEEPQTIGMLKKAKDFIAWGEVPDETAKQLFHLKQLRPPKGGFRSLKQAYPKGDLGYRGKEISEMIKRMM